jgi:hypothetical protein
MRSYIIRAGASFVTTDTEGKTVTLTGGQPIELEDDVAAAHADKVEPASSDDTGTASAPSGE